MIEKELKPKYSIHGELLDDETDYDFVKLLLFPNSTEIQRCLLGTYDVIKEINRRIEKGEKI